MKKSDGGQQHNNQPMNGGAAAAAAAVAAARQREADVPPVPQVQGVGHPEVAPPLRLRPRPRPGLAPGEDEEPARVVERDAYPRPYVRDYRARQSPPPLVVVQEPHGVVEGRVPDVPGHEDRVAGDDY